MKEGSTEAPTRHVLDWQSDDFYDEAALDAELRRQFDICHGCRRCFNLCDSFPRLFDLIDESTSGELDSVDSGDFPAIIDACTLCDMCFMTKCPYVPPHEFNLDFPHLMLRARATNFKENGNAVFKKGGRAAFTQGQLAQTDRNGAVFGAIAPLTNWANASDNKLTRPVMHGVAGIDKQAALPHFTGRTFMARAADSGFSAPRPPKTTAPKTRQAVLYATCSVNYNAPQIGEAAANVLTALGVDFHAAYPGCCGMPYLEQGNLDKVAAQAVKVASALRPFIDDGHDIITLTASCALMFKFEWALLLPDNDDVKVLSAATKDICEYVVDIARNEGLAALALDPAYAPQNIAVHLACHARAQNIGPKAAEMLRLLPDMQAAANVPEAARLKISVVERCSGHGGTFGVLKETRPLAVKVGTPAARQVAKSGAEIVCSDCPLAAKHLAQLAADMPDAAGETKKTEASAAHPIEVFAQALGL